jgi:hypothetical protein
MDMKKCSRCGELLTYDYFYVDPKKKDGHRNPCKKCCSEKGKIARRINGDRLRSQWRAHYYANRERIRNYQKTYEKKVQELGRTDKVLWSKILMKHIRARSKREGIVCTITYKDIPIPDTCPIFGIPLKKNKLASRYDSATVDRINPDGGYVPGNVIVISSRANAIKLNVTPEEILMVGNFFKEMACRQ